MVAWRWCAIFWSKGAAEIGHPEVAKLLMVYGADINARNNKGRLPIDMEYRNTEVKK